MLDREIGIRCILIWAAFGIFAIVAPLSFLLHSDGLGRLGMISAAAGFVLLVLNDNAKTRRVVRLGLRDVAEAQMGAREPLTPTPIR